MSDRLRADLGPTLAPLAAEGSTGPAASLRAAAPRAAGHDTWLDELVDRADEGGVQLTGPGGFLLEMIKAVLERSPAAELTGHLGYEAGDPAGRASHALSAAGFLLSLDDFGEGYTSLSQLRDLPVSEVKLDRSFVAGMGENPADRAIAVTVLHLANSLHLRVVAEGVETAEQAAELAALGYDTLQGWHLGRPCPARTLEHRLHAGAGRLPAGAVDDSPDPPDTSRSAPRCAQAAP